MNCDVRVAVHVVRILNSLLRTLSNRKRLRRGRSDLDELKSLSQGNGHEWLITFCFELL